MDAEKKTKKKTAAPCDEVIIFIYIIGVVSYPVRLIYKNILV